MNNYAVINNSEITKFMALSNKERKNFVFPIFAFSFEKKFFMSGIMGSISSPSPYEEKPNIQYPGLRWVKTNWFNLHNRWVLFDEITTIRELSFFSSQHEKSKKYIFFVLDVFSVYDISKVFVKVIDYDSKKSVVCTLEEIYKFYKENKTEIELIDHLSELKYNSSIIEFYNSINNLFFIKNAFVAKMYFEARKLLLTIQEEYLNLLHTLIEEDYTMKK